MLNKVRWEFPLPRTHTGILLGNGNMGVMVWGEGSIVRVTIGRADLWDHRGGMAWSENLKFSTLRKFLESNDIDGIRELFKIEKKEGDPDRPSILPLGRVEINLGAGAELEEGFLNLLDGTVNIHFTQNRKKKMLCCIMNMDTNTFHVKLPDDIDAELSTVTSWEYVGDYLHKIGFEKPTEFNYNNGGGFTMVLPVDPAITLGYVKKKNEVVVVTARGENKKKADIAAVDLLDKANINDSEILSRNWWSEYWRKCAMIDVPNEKLQMLYSYGMYKFGILTNPTAVPATLQGPWVEEYQMPPWSNDYHFNINVQMCYWPAYLGNKVEHLLPLFKMIMSWKDSLRENARKFLGINDGYMLPHAVDDHAVFMGGFWTGAIDHGCTAWVAQMMYRYYLCTHDIDFLKDTAYPFMKGAMRVYEEMLEKVDGQWQLPVSVSPEYRGCDMNAWGVNASFQLACIHRLCEDLMSASEVLGVEQAKIWSEINNELPKACLIGNDKTGSNVGWPSGRNKLMGDEQIALWQGVPLEESHRHHSHMAGITPFDVLDIDSDPEWRAIVARTMNSWIFHGPGLWSGWCVPWAVMLYLHFNLPDPAELLLENWMRVFTNVGHGTLHDADIPGFTLFGQSIDNIGKPKGGEIMQIEAGMAAVAAIQEMMTHSRRGVQYFFVCPTRWKSAEFKNILADGGFLISGKVENYKVQQIIIKSKFGGIIKFMNPFNSKAIMALCGTTISCQPGINEVEMKVGGVMVIKSE